ncbi:large-conductance mechanosensitive channel protein MscL [Pasteurella atlantica]|uniref:Large-conductance mechanosensitive channel protein MscL n=3 Tax=Pasteurellaceae TaxID=712 RepID=A0ACC6HN03_9PAST|nr:large-conductance mechanosensitive channel protein MscL [Pasteurella atlantica]MBR0572991.1 large-conductance mechanosensitive channel protein MscL [Pasteurella atlantica]MDP8033135.1 large-conductance mechanosensitive channel protein MscL [Pasteurella atlantica]MDP8035072.1 large-conductance mechanosensitive channel protein MscL [Pasteurella atlantica]MDP8036968.1 large-conductance mechanosensitive channel protein MscL [Pasteurella atlantica]MDP8038882.1 large-conductance mechanosensitive 
MSILKEFKQFAIKGNVVDLAVGVVIGSAFGKIVASFVKDIIMPPLGVLIGGVDFKDLAIVLKAATEKTAAVTMNYGIFIQTIFDFLIIAAAIFMVVKVINKMKKAEIEEEEKKPKAPTQEELLTEIRDLLQK